LANDKTSPLGSWRIAADDNSAVSVLEGMENIRNQITYAKGADVTVGRTEFIWETKINMTDKSEFAEAIAAAAKGADIVVMVLGEHGLQSGEGRSRVDIGLPGVQQNY
jgi:beta-glucosidase